MVTHFQRIVTILRQFDSYFNESEMHTAVRLSMKYCHHSKYQEIAEIITAIYPDSRSVIAGLLLSIIESNNLKSININNLFTSEILDILNVLVKLFKDHDIYDDVALETINKLSLNIHLKIRVLLIRFAYLLHPIIFDSTILHIKHNIISQEISKIYVPLFKAIKVEEIQSALQDACFQHLHPKLYNTTIDFLAREHLNFELVAQSIDELHNILSVTNIEYTISGRIKSPYSIVSKILHKSISIEKLYDIVGIRIIVAKEHTCYNILDVIHKHYNYIPSRYKDFIQYSKKNGYQSLHTVIINTDLKNLEVQIRTKSMHYVAEYGIASHLQYKIQLKGANHLKITFSALNKLIFDSLSYKALSYFIMNDYTRIDSRLFTHRLLLHRTNLQNQYQETPLHVSVRRGDYELTKVLLAQAVNPNVQNQYQETPLH
ncbi:MAG TPA: hypothetical protein LFV92_07965, partial [Rickettsia endosymbiont of Ceroptres masudai]|nr:hypothetical protein [Rickettsia endosymbiont of Ceroptres masudai]